MNRILKNDKVKVITGRYKGSIGVVLQVFPKTNRVLVKGVNIVKKKVKGSSEYENKEAPIHISNVALIDPKTEKPVKVGFSKNKEGNKIRVVRKTGVEIPVIR